MGGTHKKKLRAEKAKVKLKGAKLPKGLNVTKTEFKVRKITIRQQQQDVQQYSEGQRILNIKESLNRLKYNSVGTKMEALRNLREAIENRQPDVAAQRAAIVQNLSAMSLEIEQEPRRESFRTMGALLASLNGTDEIAPFFHIISSHLRCAMTHITQALQEDSLLLLDVLLKHTPQQVAADSARILQNFLEMISRVRAEGDQAGRTLVVHMKHSQTAVKWRSKVLLRLQQMLQKLVEHNAMTRATGETNSTVARIQNFNVRQPQYYTLKRHCPTSADHAALFTSNFNAAGCNSETIESVVQKETTALRIYIEHLMPLLLESWMEVRPEASANNAQIFLHTDAASTLQIVLEIMHCLWTLVAQHEQLLKNRELSLWFQKQYALNFANNLMCTPQFPYQQLQQQFTKQKHAKNIKQNSVQLTPSAKETQSCLRQNLCIVQLMCLFFDENDNNTHHHHHNNNNNKQKDYNNNIKVKFHELIVYVTSVLKNINNHIWSTAEDYQSLMQALRALLLRNVRKLLPVHKEHILQLLQSLITAYLEQKFPQASGLQADVLVLLGEIAENPELFLAYGGQKQFEIFLQQLPMLLLKPSISERALLAMTRLGKQQNRIFLHSLESQIAPVIQNIQRIQVANAANALEGRKQIINLFYWTSRSWQNFESKLQQLLKLIEENITDKRVASYLEFILKAEM